MQVAANRRIVVKRFAAGVAHLIVGGAGLVLSLETLPEARVFTVLIVVGGSAALFGLLLRARRHDLPVVLMTGGSQEPERTSNAIKLGATSLLYKPFSHDELCRVVESALADGR